ncbi:Mom family adenine methylcarbamoylation protein [Noviherbaspirillum galbum]|uniref:Uncharacterized protein n=1 Tax=Noviherbaspirillum galbum TaxID=2709383 RepID=A0A6B3SHH0_9BURK|nr:hypothetical protein [Noviherbaspirillum galbum]NEX60103.1 hypothetical protein [Noviherbaspirillum galbum]
MMQQMSLEWLTGEAGSQRWRQHQSRFVPPAVRFDPSRVEVTEIPEAIAKPFVLGHHYSGSYPAARFRVGLFVKPVCGDEYLGGVAVFSVPMQNAAVPKYLGVEAGQGVELGRLVLLDDPLLGFNAESWFVSRAFRLLRARLPQIAGVLSYSDPMARYAQDGSKVFPGHAGIVYRALSGHYHGRSSARTLIVAKDGRTVSERALSKIRLGESGVEYAIRQLQAMGAPGRLPFEDGAGYVARALEEGGFRRVKHPGNHVFSWTLRRAVASPPSSH